MLTEPKLTGPQREELKRLSKEPQTTYGRHRARVQNNLVMLGLAEHVRTAEGHRCRITEAGRAALNDVRAALRAALRDR